MVGCGQQSIFLPLSGFSRSGDGNDNVVAMELAVETKLSAKPVLEPNDTTALTEDQQRALDEYKIKTRIDNELYLRQHPEISLMLSAFMSDVLNRRPPNIKRHAADYFTDPHLPDKVKAEHVRITAASQRITPDFH